MTDSPKLLRRLMKVLKGVDVVERDKLIAERDDIMARFVELKHQCLFHALTDEGAPSSNERIDAWIAILSDARYFGSRILYLDLMEATLTGALFEDPPLPTFGDTVYAANLRDRGLDWPSSAFSMIGAERMRNLRTLLEDVIKTHVPGDIVETGVWRGGASIMARAVLKAHDVRDRKVILADSFEGLPPPDESHFPADAGSTFHQFPELAVSMEQVQDNFRRFGLLDEQVLFAKGWFKDTMPSLPTERIAILRLDGDMYESTIQPLEHLYDRIALGGWIIVDDYDIIPACKAAVTDFLAKRGLNPKIVPIDGVGVYFQKEPVGAGSQTQHSR
jgi:O-methyltransferase